WQGLRAIEMAIEPQASGGVWATLPCYHAPNDPMHERHALIKPHRDIAERDHRLPLHARPPEQVGRQVAFALSQHAMNDRVLVDIDRRIESERPLISRWQALDHLGGEWSGIVREWKS